MVAYSFMRQFVVPIYLGLQIRPPGGALTIEPWHRPKRHTIRSPRRPPARHAHSGDPISLWCEQRRPSRFKIGNAWCDASADIVLDFTRDRVKSGAGHDERGALLLDIFARSDGFPDWAALREFWREVHGVTTQYQGIIIAWRPLGSRRP